MTGVRDIIQRVSEALIPDIDDLVSLLSVQDDADVREIMQAADATRKRFMGDGVLLRGIVEFSSYCSNTCFYCGLHGGNARITRYRMTDLEVLSSVAAIAAQGIRTVVLQSGEDESLDTRWLAEVVRGAKKQDDMAVTLSVGERPRGDYEMWREAGADRYLLKRNRSLGPKLETRGPVGYFDALSSVFAGDLSSDQAVSHSSPSRFSWKSASKCFSISPRCPAP